MSHLKCLYFFSSSEIDILEIKRIDQPEGAPLSEIYKWLIISNKTRKVLELDFKSMDKNNLEEVRVFLEGELSFNNKSANLKLLGRSVSLVREDPERVSTDKLERVKNYVSQKLHKGDSYSFRDLKPSDVNFFKEWIFDQEVIRYSMTKFHRMADINQVLDWFHSILFDSKTFQLGIIDLKSQALIGYAGIAALNEVDGNGEYFIFIGNKSFWGKGIATQVTRQMIEIGFQSLKLHRIFLTASSKNPGAIRAYEKAGFLREGKMREAFHRNNEYSDKIIMGILRNEFVDL